MTATASNCPRVNFHGSNTLPNNSENRINCWYTTWERITGKCFMEIFLGQILPQIRE